MPLVVWSAVVAFAGFYPLKRLVGLRAPEDEERGLDITAHGERLDTPRALASRARSL
ncbi:MAG TPA: hypothetical protein VLV29_08690 [Steroidobacteraceae bacterium]|nr:hypothetical protein [Steroidobacteraceae bacterium]